MSCGCNNYCYPRFRRASNDVINNNYFLNPIDFAQFSALATQTVAPAGIIELTDTNANTNIEAFSLNDNGTISLTAPGSYSIMYSVTVNNTTGAAQPVVIGLNVNGVVDPRSQSSTTIETGTTSTLTGQTIITVTNTPTTVSLVNNSATEVVVNTANLIVQKIR